MSFCLHSLFSPLLSFLLFVSPFVSFLSPFSSLISSPPFLWSFSFLPFLFIFLSLFHLLHHISQVRKCHRVCDPNVSLEEIIKLLPLLPHATLRHQCAQHKGGTKLPKTHTQKKFMSAEEGRRTDRQTDRHTDKKKWMEDKDNLPW